MTKSPIQQNELAVPALNWQRWLLLAVIATVLAHVLDPLAWKLTLPGVNDKDLGRLLRIQGYLPTWGLLALAWWLETGNPVRRRQGTLLLLLAPTLGGALAELLKLFFRRLRPDPEHFGYAFRAFNDGLFSNRGMGLPSSHVLVACGGAFALALLFPRARWLFYTLAAGCAATRVLAHGHFLSDTVVAAALAWPLVILLARWIRSV